MKNLQAKTCIMCRSKYSNGSSGIPFQLVKLLLEGEKVNGKATGGERLNPFYGCCFKTSQVAFSHEGVYPSKHLFIGSREKMHEGRSAYSGLTTCRGKCADQCSTLYLHPQVPFKCEKAIRLGLPVEGKLGFLGTSSPMSCPNLPTSRHSCVWTNTEPPSCWPALANAREAWHCCLSADTGVLIPPQLAPPHWHFMCCVDAMM